MTIYFRPTEFLCKCARPECEAPTQMAASVLDPLNTLRERAGRPLLVTSGLRCPEWNVAGGGVLDSEHLTGEGVDILAATSAERWTLLAANYSGSAPLFDRVGIGRTFMHFGASPHHPRHVAWTYYPKEGNA